MQMVTKRQQGDLIYLEKIDFQPKAYKRKKRLYNKERINSLRYNNYK